MNRANILKLQPILYILSLVILSACGQASLATPTPTLTASPTASPTITVTPIPTNTSTPQPTSTPEIKQFPLNSAENWSDCEVVPEDFRAYADWTEKNLIKQGLNISIPQPDPNKANAFAGPNGNHNMFYALKKGVPLSDRPWALSPWFCKTELAMDWNGKDHKGTFALTAIAFSVPGKPGEIVVNPILFQKAYPGNADLFIKQLKDELVNARAIVFGQVATKGDIVNIIPVAEMNEKNFPELEKNMEDFFADLDPTHIDGVVLDAVEANVR